MSTGTILVDNAIFVYVAHPMLEWKYERTRQDWDMTDGYFISVDEVEAVQMRDGISRRTLATTDEAMLCQFTLQQNSFVAPHSHMNDQVGYIVSGKVEITIGEETRTITAGGSYAVPGGLVHSVRALEDTIEIDVFSPPRSDYKTEAR